MNKKKVGVAYYSTRRQSFCTLIDENKYKDLTTGYEFEENDNSTIRQIMPEDLLDSTILVESTKDSKSSYIRVSYCDVDSTQKINDLISIDMDKNSKLIGIRLNYEFI